MFVVLKSEILLSFTDGEESFSLHANDDVFRSLTFPSGVRPGNLSC